MTRRFTGLKALVLGVVVSGALTSFQGAVADGGIAEIYFGVDTPLQEVFTYVDCDDGGCQTNPNSGEASASAFASGNQASDARQAWMGSEFKLVRRCDSQPIAAAFDLVFSYAAGSASSSAAGSGTSTAELIARGRDPGDAGITVGQSQNGVDTLPAASPFTLPDVQPLPEQTAVYRPTLAARVQAATQTSTEELPASASATASFDLNQILVRFNDDTDPEVGTITLVSDDEPTADGYWYQKPVSFTVPASDPVELGGLAIGNSCVERATAVVDGTESPPYAYPSSQAPISTAALGDGKYSVFFRVRDYAGNEVATDPILVGVDQLAPAISDGNGAVPTLLPATPTGKNDWYSLAGARPHVTVKCDDGAGEVSVCKGVMYRFNSASWSNGGAMKDIAYPEGGDRILEYHAPDNAGNGDVTTKVTFPAIDVDMRAPSPGFQPALQPDGWYNSLATIVARCASDPFPGSGCNSAFNDEFKCLTEQDRTTRAWAIEDFAGNEVTGSFLMGCDITTPPIPTITRTVSALEAHNLWYTNQAPAWEFSCVTDDRSGIERYDIRVNGATLATRSATCVDGKHSYAIPTGSLYPNKQYCLRAVAVDNAGNADVGITNVNCLTYDIHGADMLLVSPPAGLTVNGAHFGPTTGDRRYVMGSIDVTFNIVDETGTRTLNVWRHKDSGAGSPGTDELKASCAALDLTQCTWNDAPLAYTQDTDIHEMFATGTDYAGNGNTSLQFEYTRVALATVAAECENVDPCATVVWPVYTDLVGSIIRVYRGDDPSTLFTSGNRIATLAYTTSGEYVDTSAQYGNSYVYGLEIVRGLSTIRTHKTLFDFTSADAISEPI